MFTGIISDVGEILELTERETGVKLKIATDYDPGGIDIGASIACAGACLTVIERGTTGNRRWFDVEASVETLDKTTMSAWQAGTKINLERALKLGDELGGHMVTGHVDGVGELVEREDVADMAKLTFRAPSALSHFIAAKGSVTLNGTSLTVNSVDGDIFTVMLIPHTLEVTTWGTAKAGDKVNLEIDIMARYLARMVESGAFPGARAA
ncbi:Riboflavin synthase [Hartmannibacter diazotrophicus]|uniref:Riboflavin synthase n=1 Tax=Hartmannibacter diazotrophicus TaxID=1482074 RepID=A0A2C9D7C1_9HYPH|nr:riboflavin synthase [Hartmannibacter diazotrophicus]SON56133.1 Riboflavin synthase [Hartmannibacter diazotrophicus]